MTSNDTPVQTATAGRLLCGSLGDFFVDTEVPGTSVLTTGGKTLSDEVLSFYTCVNLPQDGLDNVSGTCAIRRVL